MDDKEFEAMLRKEVAEAGGTVLERVPSKLYAREWHVSLPAGRTTQNVYWDGEEGVPRASYTTKASRLSPTKVHSVMIDTTERLRAYLRKLSGTG